MADELEYVVHGALMMCDKGTAPGFFSPTYNMKTKVNGCLVTTAMDKLPITNIPSFTVCSISQKPCIPVPTKWDKTYKVKVQGEETLLARSCMQCGIGGKIEFVTSGQVPLPQDALDDIKAMQEAGAEPEEDDSLSWWDAAELIPVIGSGIGIYREAKKGNWWMAAANVGFLISDVAGVVSFGATTAASTAGKTALKTGVKVAGKSATKTAAKKVGLSGIKTAVKLTAKGAKEVFKKSIDDIINIASKGKLCVFACFPAGTKVHTEVGIRNIEDIHIGDRVWAYNEETKEYGLKEVLHTMSRESDHSIQLYADREMIETTIFHPFYTSDGWKEAGDLEVGDSILTKQGESVEIKEIIYQYKSKKVFNFEVENWHTYFVGALAWLVHNAKKCASEGIKKITNRLKYLGRTPGKNSKTGKEVFERMMKEIPPKARIKRGQKEFYDQASKKWRKLSDADMGHIEDAVHWWNREGRKYGPKSKEVREWMLNSKNYELEYFKLNRSRGGKLTEVYKEPLK